LSYFDHLLRDDLQHQPHRREEWKMSAENTSFGSDVPF